MILSFDLLARGSIMPREGLPWIIIFSAVFGVDSLNCFAFKARSDRQTDRQKQLITLSEPSGAEERSRRCWLTCARAQRKWWRWIGSVVCSRAAVLCRDTCESRSCDWPVSDCAWPPSVDDWPSHTPASQRSSDGQSVSQSTRPTLVQLFSLHFTPGVFTSFQPLALFRRLGNNILCCLIIMCEVADTRNVRRVTQYSTMSQYQLSRPSAGTASQITKLIYWSCIKQYKSFQSINIEASNRGFYLPNLETKLGAVLL